MKKRVIALMLGAAMMAGVMAPAFADEKVYDWKVNGHDIEANADGNSEEEVGYYEPIEGKVDGTEDSKAADVYAIVGSTYQVTIPKVIVLSGASKNATYNVDVDGDIAGNEYVLVKPAESVTMKQKGKADVTGTITQATTKFYAKNNTATMAAGSILMNALDTDTVSPKTEEDVKSEASGTVDAQGLTAGKWSGTFNFDIQLINEDEQ